MASYSSNYRALLRKQSTLLTLLALAISLFCAALAIWRVPASVDWLHYDLTQQYSRLPAASDIVIIEIDDASLHQLGPWPWPRSRHAQLLSALTPAGPALVVFDVLFPSADPRYPDADADFARAIRHSGKVVLPLFFEALGPRSTVVETLPHHTFQQHAKAIGHVHVGHEHDGVVRTVFLHAGISSAYWPHLSLAAHRVISNTAATEQARPAIAVDNVNIGLVHADSRLLPMPAADQGLLHFSFSDVVLGRVDTQQFADKVIFVGATATGLGDRFTTPVGTLPGVELNAWLFHALQTQRLMQPVPPIWQGLITFFCLLALVSLLGRRSPRAFLLLTLGSIVGVIVSGSLLVLHAGWWLPVSGIVIGLSLFFPLWSWLRAESMLRFLRHEMRALHAPPEQQTASARATASATARATASELASHSRTSREQDYLAALGFIDTKGESLTNAGFALIHGPLAATQSSNEARQTAALHDVDADPAQHLLAILARTESTAPQTNETEGVELISRTIAQLERARQQDLHQRQLIEQTLSGLQDAVCVASLSGEISYCNARFTQWFASDTQGRPDDLLALLGTLRLESAQTWPEVLQALYLSLEPFSDEALLHNGTTPACPEQVLCNAAIVATRSPQPDTLIFVFTDITGLKAAEQARTEALSFLSHDLRAPMVSVLSLLERVNARDAGLTHTQVGHIETLVRKNLDFAESFLQWSRADKLPESKLAPCDCHAVLDSAQVHAQALAAPAELNIVTQRCAEDAWVLGEQSLLERAMHNLISNAVKHSPPASTVIISLKREVETVCLSVTDNGPGIAKAEQQHLFKRFSRVAGNDKAGAGLGLNFVAKVAEKCGGIVRVESDSGAGAKFIIRLPLLAEADLM